MLAPLATALEVLDGSANARTTAAEVPPTGRKFHRRQKKYPVLLYFYVRFGQDRAHKRVAHNPHWGTQRGGGVGAG